MSQSSLEFTQQAVAHCSSPREITGVVFNIVIAKQLVSQFGQQAVAQKSQQPVGELLYATVTPSVIAAPPPVIPAKAGIHHDSGSPFSGDRHKPQRQLCTLIPASQGFASAMDSRLRGNDEGDCGNGDDVIWSDNRNDAGGCFNA